MKTHIYSQLAGITGQDGFYLTQLLLTKDYVVHGLVRPCSSRDSKLTQLCEEYGTRVILHFGDVLDTACLAYILSLIKITEIYHLAAQSHVGLSFHMPQYTNDVNALGTLRLLEVIVLLKLTDTIKFAM